MQVTDLTKALLQGLRLLYRTTKPVRRVLRPFAGLLSALAVVIAAVGFVYNDTVRDRERAANRDLEAALASFYAAGETSDIISSIHELIAIQTTLRPEDQDIQRLEARVRSSEYGTAKRLENLLRALPQVRELEPLRNSQPALIRIYNLFFQACLPLDQQKSLSQADRLRIEMYGKSYFEETQLITDMVRSAFMEESFKERNRLNFATGTSWVLYLIGFIIGLLGQIAGLKITRP
jgi:hypothetical protein